MLLKEFSASASLPSLVTITIAPWWRIKDSAHSSLLTSPWLCVNVMAKDGKGDPWLQPLLGRYLSEVANAVIKAKIAYEKASSAISLSPGSPPILKPPRVVVRGLLSQF
jgi:hypothetical protein